MDASYRSTEVLIWNCHNQHGNQVTFNRSLSVRTSKVINERLYDNVGCDFPMVVVSMPLHSEFVKFTNNLNTIKLWKYRSGQMYHPTSKKCASVSTISTTQSKSPTSQNAIKMIPCDGDDPTQQWIWQFTNSTILTRFNSNPERSVNGD